jgi:hypothetical protein
MVMMITVLMIRAAFRLYFTASTFRGQWPLVLLMELRRRDSKSEG